MRVVIQRVISAQVSVEEVVTGKIGTGLLIFLGIEHEDRQEDASWLVEKIRLMRIFNDAQGKMNLCLEEVGGGVLVISQFTLHASTKKGNRPSYIMAARPDLAIPLYNYFIGYMSSQTGKPVAAGIFGANMQVSLLNDGPVTILMDSKNKN